MSAIVVILIAIFVFWVKTVAVYTEVNEPVFIDINMDKMENVRNIGENFKLHPPGFAPGGGIEIIVEEAEKKHDSDDGTIEL